MISGNTFWSDNNLNPGVAIVYNQGTSSSNCLVNAIISNVSVNNNGVLQGQYSPIQIPMVTSASIEEPDKYNI